MDKSNKKIQTYKSFYTTTPLYLAQDLNIDMTELTLLIIIYNVIKSSELKSGKTWYNLHYDTIMPMINMKRATLKRLITRLIEKELLMRNPEKRGLYCVTLNFVSKYDKYMSDITVSSNFAKYLNRIESERSKLKIAK